MSVPGQPCPPESDEKTCPWDEESRPPAWWAAELDRVGWIPIEEGGVLLWYAKTADCPRCHHPDAIDIRVPAQGWEGVSQRDVTEDVAVAVEGYTGAATEKVDANTVFVRCRCGRKHDGRPEDTKRGCGHGGYIAGPLDEG
jgi:hypothetical protein